MDAWSPDQLRKMQLGGNDTLNNFLGKYSVDKFTEIKDKYNSQAAEVTFCLYVLHLRLFSVLYCADASARCLYICLTLLPRSWQVWFLPRCTVC